MLPSADKPIWLHVMRGSRVFAPLDQYCCHTSSLREHSWYSSLLYLSVTFQLELADFACLYWLMMQIKAKTHIPNIFFPKHIKIPHKKLFVFWFLGLSIDHNNPQLTKTVFLVYQFWLQCPISRIGGLT